jgi:hypothetical protein
MTNDPLYSSASAAMLIAMTALQCADGVASDVALQNAHEAWREHINVRGNDSWPFSELITLVSRLTR